MVYQRMIPATFLHRPNRFIAEISIDGRKEICHVKNTGRCRELLTNGAKIYVQESDNPNRKTKYDLINVYKGTELINMDSQAPNKVVGEWLAGPEAESIFGNVTKIRPETTFANSRFDFYLESVDEDGSIRKSFIEVKGVTLENEGIARFPDAPSERAVKHLRELEKAREQGYDAYVFFVIQMTHIKELQPNWDTHKVFAETLCQIAKNGVSVLAFDCMVSKDSLQIQNPIPVILGQQD